MTKFESFRAASKLKFLIFHVYTPSRKMEKKRISHTNKEQRRN